MYTARYRCIICSFVLTRCPYTQRCSSPPLSMVWSQCMSSVCTAQRPSESPLWHSSLHTHTHTHTCTHTHTHTQTHTHTHAHTHLHIWSMCVHCFNNSILWCFWVSMCQHHLTHTVFYIVRNSLRPAVLVSDDGVSPVRLIGMKNEMGQLHRTQQNLSLMLVHYFDFVYTGFTLKLSFLKHWHKLFLTFTSKHCSGISLVILFWCWITF